VDKKLYDWIQGKEGNAAEKCDRQGGGKSFINLKIKETGTYQSLCWGEGERIKESVSRKCAFKGSRQDARVGI